MTLLDLPRPASLTPREREVMDFVADGMLDREIAAHLGIQTETVGKHVEWARVKLGLVGATRVELARVWLEATGEYALPPAEPIEWTPENVDGLIAHMKKRGPWNFTMLAAALGTDRRSLFNWRKGLDRPQHFRIVRRLDEFARIHRFTGVAQ